MRYALVVLTLAIATSASAQSPTLKIAYASFAASQALDAASTHLALSRGAREANGNVSGCVQSLGCSLSLKAAISMGVILAVHKSVAPKSPKAAFWLLIGFSAAQGVIDLHNFSVARQQR